MNRLVVRHSSRTIPQHEETTMEQDPARSTRATTTSNGTGTSTTSPTDGTTPTVGDPVSLPASLPVSLPVSFITGDTQSELLDGGLHFDPDDPYAVRMQLEARSGTVTWTFARQLLVDGLYEPTGAGDVQVWPCLNGAGEAVVIVELYSPDGVGVLQASARRVHEFVSRTLEVLPVGQESARLPIDELIERLLSD